MKRVITLLTALFLVVCGAAAVWASDGSASGNAGNLNGRRVYDFAGILSTQDEEALELEVARTSGRIGMDIVVLTAAEKEGAALREYADDFYDNGGFGTGSEKSGLILFIDMEERTVYLGTMGDAITYYTDERIYDMTDGDDILYDDLAAGDYRGAVERCLGRMVYFYEIGVDPKQYTYEEAVKAAVPKRITLLELIIAILIPAVIGFLVVNSIRKEYAMKTEKKQAANYRLAYRTVAAFAFATTGDELVNRTVSRRVIPVITGSGRGRGGSSGRSTIHMGGSGTFHGGGGGGRHF